MRLSALEATVRAPAVSLVCWGVIAGTLTSVRILHCALRLLCTHAHTRTPLHSDVHLFTICTITQYAHPSPTPQPPAPQHPSALPCSSPTPPAPPSHPTHLWPAGLRARSAAQPAMLPLSAPPPALPSLATMAISLRIGYVGVSDLFTPITGSLCDCPSWFLFTIGIYINIYPWMLPSGRVCWGVRSDMDFMEPSPIRKSHS